MERQDHTAQQRTTQQSAPQNSRWSRIRVFNRPQSEDSQSPVMATVLIILAVIVLVVVGIIIF